MSQICISAVKLYADIPPTDTGSGQLGQAPNGILTSEFLNDREQCLISYPDKSKSLASQGRVTSAVGRFSDRIYWDGASHVVGKKDKQSTPRACPKVLFFLISSIRFDSCLDSCSRDRHLLSWGCRLTTLGGAQMGKGHMTNQYI